MKRWLCHVTISAYVLTLLGGIACQTLNYCEGAHPMMYYIIWDMFCGWAAYEDRVHILAEGESGRFYELAPGPWGCYEPFGNVARHHYDTFRTHAPTLAVNCLRQTRHEPIQRILVIEEWWPKKFNLPDPLWRKRYNEPKDLQRYYHVQAIYTPDGQPVRTNSSWLAYQNELCLNDNPRLVADSRKGKPLFSIDPRNRASRSDLLPSGAVSSARSVVAPLGN